jgi:hypothetical protein
MHNAFVEVYIVPGKATNLGSPKAGEKMPLTIMAATGFLCAPGWLISQQAWVCSPLL